MDWVWELYRVYVTRRLQRAGDAEPDDQALQAAFIEVLGASTVTVLVQVPWQNSVRFKGLARYGAAEMMPLISAPMPYLRAHFGGGKFKLNFHHGWHFVATQNFKPDGEPIWQDLPEIDF